MDWTEKQIFKSNLDFTKYVVLVLKLAGNHQSLKHELGFRKQLETCRLLKQKIPEALVTPAFRNISLIQLAILKSSLQSMINLNRILSQLALEFLRKEVCTPRSLQACLRFTIEDLLAPSWSKISKWLITGENCLQSRTPQDAVQLEVLVTDSELFFSLQAGKLKLYPCDVTTLGLEEDKLKYFLSDPGAILSSHNVPALRLGGTVHVIPSMRQVFVASITRKIPPSCPYSELSYFVEHWKWTHGLDIPADPASTFFINVNFSSSGGTLYTYPHWCIHDRQPFLLRRYDPGPILEKFLKDVSNLGLNISFLPMAYSLSSSVAPASQVRQGANDNLVPVTADQAAPPYRTVDPKPTMKQQSIFDMLSREKRQSQAVQEKNKNASTPSQIHHQSSQLPMIPRGHRPSDRPSVENCGQVTIKAAIDQMQVHTNERKLYSEYASRSAQMNNSTKYSPMSAPTPCNSQASQNVARSTADIPVGQEAVTPMSKRQLQGNSLSAAVEGKCSTSHSLSEDRTIPLSQSHKDAASSATGPSAEVQLGNHKDPLAIAALSNTADGICSRKKFEYIGTSLTVKNEITANEDEERIESHMQVIQSTVNASYQKEGLLPRYTNKGPDFLAGREGLGSKHEVGKMKKLAEQFSQYFQSASSAPRLSFKPQDKSRVQVALVQPVIRKHYPHQQPQQAWKLQPPANDEANTLSEKTDEPDLDDRNIIREKSRQDQKIVEDKTGSENGKNFKNQIVQENGSKESKTLEMQADQQDVIQLLPTPDNATESTSVVKKFAPVFKPKTFTQKPFASPLPLPSSSQKTIPQFMVKKKPFQSQVSNLLSGMGGKTKSSPEVTGMKAIPVFGPLSTNTLGIRPPAGLSTISKPSALRKPLLPSKVVKPCGKQTKIALDKGPHKRKPLQLIPNGTSNISPAIQHAPSEKHPQDSQNLPPQIKPPPSASLQKKTAKPQPNLPTTIPRQDWLPEPTQTTPPVSVKSTEAPSSQATPRKPVMVSGQFRQEGLSNPGLGAKDEHVMSQNMAGKGRQAQTDQDRSSQPTPKKPRTAPKVAADANVEELARLGQLSKVNAATVTAWLKSRGVTVKSKDKRQDLNTKVLEALGLNCDT